MIGFMMVLPLLPFYALELHATPETIGAMIASFSIAQLLSAPLWGRVSDRYGRRPALLIGLWRLGHRLRGLRVGRLASGCCSPRASCRARAAEPPAWRRPTWPTPSSPRTGPGRSAGSPSATAAGVILGPAIGSFAAHFGPAAPGLVAAALCLVNVLLRLALAPGVAAAASARDASAPRRPLWHPAWQVIRHPREPVSRLHLDLRSRACSPSPR